MGSTKTNGPSDQAKRIVYVRIPLISDNTGTRNAEDTGELPGKLRRAAQQISGLHADGYDLIPGFTTLTEEDGGAVVLVLAFAEGPPPEGDLDLTPPGSSTPKKGDAA